MNTTYQGLRFVNYESTKLDNAYVLLYKGHLEEIGSHVTSLMMDALVGIIKHEGFVATGKKPVVYFSDLNVYFVHQRFEKKLPKTCINITDKIVNFLNNYTFRFDDGQFSYHCKTIPSFSSVFILITPS